MNLSNRHKSTQIALGGMSAALCLVVMLGSAIVPFGTYALPMLAGVMLLPLACEMGGQVAAIAFASVSFLSLLIVPDRETSLMFICFFGYYPILKPRLDALRWRWLRFLLKLLLFNTAMLAGYWVVIHLFGLTYLLDEMRGWGGVLLLVVGNIFLPVYEHALSGISLLYRCRLRNLLFK